MNPDDETQAVTDDELFAREELGPPIAYFFSYVCQDQSYSQYLSPMNWHSLLTPANAKNEDLVLAMLEISFAHPEAGELLTKYSEFWDAAWKNCGLAISETEEFPLLPQLSSFTLLRGRLLYQKFSELDEEITQIKTEGKPVPEELGLARNTYLIHAVKLMNYEAIDFLCWELVNGENSRKDIQSFRKAIELAVHSATIYRAPGYALFAKLANFCATALPEKTSERFPMDILTTKLHFYSLAYNACEQAEKTLSASNKEVTVAYEFEDFAERHQEVGSFSKMKDTIRTNMIRAQAPLRKGKFHHSIPVPERAEVASSYITRTRRQLFKDETATATSSSPPVSPRA